MPQSISMIKDVFHGTSCIISLQTCRVSWDTLYNFPASQLNTWRRGLFIVILYRGHGSAAYADKIDKKGPLHNWQIRQTQNSATDNSFKRKNLYIIPVSEFNEFEPQLKSAKNRFHISAGLNLGKFNTIFSQTNHVWP